MSRVTRHLTPFSASLNQLLSHPLKKASEQRDVVVACHFIPSNCFVRWLAHLVSSLLHSSSRSLAFWPAFCLDFRQSIHSNLFLQQSSPASHRLSSFSTQIRAPTSSHISSLASHHHHSFISSQFKRAVFPLTSSHAQIFSNCLWTPSSTDTYQRPLLLQSQLTGVAADLLRSINARLNYNSAWRPPWTQQHPAHAVGGDEPPRPKATVSKSSSHLSLPHPLPTKHQAEPKKIVSQHPVGTTPCHRHPRTNYPERCAFVQAPARTRTPLQSRIHKTPRQGRTEQMLLPFPTKQACLVRKLQLRAQKSELAQRLQQRPHPKAKPPAPRQKRARHVKHRRQPSHPTI